MAQVIQVVGAVLILVAFLGAQQRRMTPESRSYLLLNLIGSVLLFGTAAADGDIGFVLLEGVWAVAAAYGLLRLRTAPR